MKIEKSFKINNEVSINVEVEQPTLGKILLPQYFEFKNKVYMMSDYLVTLNEIEFNKDMSDLMPKTLGKDWGEACLIRLQLKINSHLKQFNRITPADLECYLTEFILVISSISIRMNKPMSDVEKHKVFKDLLYQLSEKLGIQVDLII